MTTQWWLGAVVCLVVSAACKRARVMHNIFSVVVRGRGKNRVWTVSTKPISSNQQPVVLEVVAVCCLPLADQTRLADQPCTAAQLQ